ncbi:TetR/AcrR family transcriptional regulator [Amycolatopsis sp. BJA-103]|uniref:TetR/AcrR family transcriptional regulator n=1 Tax=Amycolatopsis sp. BJA-103 TaxID=1911175 RepID=UPI000C780CAB|nr:TetR/AcrR family transcriptional regulator [Amycolatopsis sp. BJA-103]AUI57724.1 TetR family transcriptional regulator [Amycolatopsis sp. BJA-103]PNE14274.1 TetR family transcriptional regulator [Amycolatopsis sp. BJA-103]
MPTPRRSQTERSQSTQTALITAARTLFADPGYAAVPADEIVRAAGVTRGALYHHFGDKQGLFRAVIEQIETEITEELQDVLRSADDPWAAALGALSRFLDLCLRPEVVRISLTDAISVLGWQEWRELENRYGLGLITEILEGVAADGRLVAAPIPELAQLVLSACAEAALMIAHAEDPEAAKEKSLAALVALLSGLLRT